MPDPPTDFCVRMSRPDDAQQMNSLFNEVFNKKRTLEEFHWKLTRSPFEGGMPMGIVAATGLRIIGMACFMPRPLSYRGKNVDAVQVVDMCISPEWQKQGVLRAMHNLYLETAADSVDFAFAFPGRFVAEMGLQSLGYHTLSSFHAYTSKLNSELTVPSNVVIDVCATIPDSWDAFLSRFQGDSDVILHRTTSYLKWRYSESPNRRFVFFVATIGGTLEGLTVVMRKAGHNVRADDVCFYEFLATSPEVVSAMIDSVQRYYGEHAKNGVYWCSDAAPWQSQFVACGFRRVKRQPSQVFGRCFRNGLGPKHDSQTVRSWHFALGDSDL